MDTTNHFPMTLLYDGACAVCAFEIEQLRARDRAGRLRFVDIAAPGFDAAACGATLETLNAEIHALLPDGRVLRGVEVLRRAYDAVGLGWVLGATAWGPLRPLADAGYRAFARRRRTISRLAAPLIDALRAARARTVDRRMRACAAGRCRVGDGDDPAGRPS